VSEAPATTHVFEVRQDSFEADVLQASLTTPIVVDFWATWCGPCKSLGPILEKLAAEFNGGFRLGKVDVDQEQQLAAVFGVKSIPTVILIKDGQIVDGFAGALPEGQVREFLTRHVQPLPAADAAAGTTPETEPETPEQAINRLQQAIAETPADAELKLELAVALQQAGRDDAAAAELAGLPVNLATDERAVRLRSKLELAQAAQGAPDLAVLQARVAANADDWDARDQLGVRLLAEGDAEAGLEQFLAILQHAPEWNDGQAKKRLLAAFATLEDAGLVGRYRRRMASMLF